MIDLMRFCASRCPNRPQIEKPFCVGEYSYATNGHILVRVARREDVPERQGSYPYIEKHLASFIGREQSVPVPQIPDYPKVPCEYCDGHGVINVCAKCGHGEFCDECLGSGERHAEGDLEDIPVCLDQTNCVTLKYLIMLQTLPNVRWTLLGRDAETQIPFFFDGGEGLLMPRRYPKVKSDRVIDLTREPAPAL